MRNRIKYSQNFLISSQLVCDLLEKSDINSSDTVLEIGAGDGVITSELVKKSAKVISYEVDNNLYEKLVSKLSNIKSLDLHNNDFMKSKLPNFRYKVFSNIPFNITGGVIKKLLLDINPPKTTYLILQKESVMKFAGKPYAKNNSQLSVILFPYFEFKIIYKFNRVDFFPKPNVDIVLVEIKKRLKPLADNKILYQDFVTYAFNQPKPNIKEGLSKIMNIEPTKLKPSNLEFDVWLNLYKLFLIQTKQKQDIVIGSFSKQLRDQENLKKVHRTRVDKNWRRY